MDKLEYALRQIAACNFCNGRGVDYFGNGEDYDFEDCICNPYNFISGANALISSHVNMSDFGNGSAQKTNARGVWGRRHAPNGGFGG